MKLILIFSIVFLALVVRADELEKLDILEELKQFEKLEMRPAASPFKNINNDFSESKKNTPFSSLYSDEFKVELSKDAILFSSDYSKKWRLSKKTILKVRVKKNNPIEAFIFKKETHQILFVIRQKDMNPIEEDLHLNPQVQTVLEKKIDKTKYHHYDKIFKTSHELTFQMENISSEYFEKLDASSNSQAKANSFNLTSYYRSKFPVHFGLSFALQKGIRQSSGIDLQSWTQFSIGPSLRYKILEWKKNQIWLKASVMQGFLFNSSFLTRTLQHKSKFLELSALISFDTFLGNLFLGTFYKRFEIETVATKIQRPNTGSFISYGLSFGYIFDWDFKYY